jgi:hypothetical protein
MLSKRLWLFAVAALVLLACVIAFRGSTGFAQEQPTSEDGVIYLGPDQTIAAVGRNAAADPPVLGEGIISMGPEAFLPWDRSITLSRDNMMMIRAMTPAGSRIALDAPLHLPQGAEIKQIVAYIEDNDATYDVELMLNVHEHTSAMGTYLDSVYSAGASSEMQYIKLTNLSAFRKIDLTRYSYFVRVFLYGGANTWLNSIRVDYSYNSMLPSVSK